MNLPSALKLDSMLSPRAHRVRDGCRRLLLESTGGVTQAFAHALKAVRMMKTKWHVDFVLRLVTEYKQRASRNVVAGRDRLKKDHRKYALENIHLLDRELARIDLILASGT